MLFLKVLPFRNLRNSYEEWIIICYRIKYARRLCLPIRFNCIEVNQFGREYLATFVTKLS